MIEKIDIYLAGPYSDPDPCVRDRRFYELTLMAAQITKLGHTVYSPITHYHPISQMVNLPTSWKYWKIIDLKYLALCKMLAVYQLEGWRESEGLEGEMKHAKAHDQPVIKFETIEEFKDKMVLLDSRF